jgi:hypothetical protein
MAILSDGKSAVESTTVSLLINVIGVRQSRRYRAWTYAISIACGIAALQTSSSVAQTMSKPSRVLGALDAMTGLPLSGVDVTDALTGDHATTTSTGTVSLWFVRERGSIVQARKLGYEPWQGFVDPQDTIPLTVLLQPVAGLAAVVTTAPFDVAKDPGLRDGFERRCSSPHVACVREDQLQRDPSHTLGDFILKTDGVSLRPCGGGKGTGRGCGLVMHTVTGAGFCVPTYFVDGYAWDTNTLGPPIEMPYQVALRRPPPYTPSNVKQVEIYTPETKRPLRFTGDPKCGTVAIWTK